MQKQRAAAAEDEVQTQPALPACASTPSPCRVAAPVATSLLRPTHGLEDLATDTSRVQVRGLFWPRNDRKPKQTSS